MCGLMCAAHHSNEPTEKMSVPIRVLIVEDSEDDVLLVVRELRRGGFGVAYKRVQTPEDLHAALDHESWDAVISDYMMPRFTGPAALRIVRGKGLDVPFIVVSDGARRNSGSNDEARRSRLHTETQP